MKPSLAPVTTLLAEVAAKAANWRQQNQNAWRHHPAASGQQMARDLTHHAVTRPLQLSAQLGLAAAKTLAEPVPWLARHVVKAGMTGAQAAKRAAVAPWRVVPGQTPNTPGAQLVAAQQDRARLRAEWNAGLGANHALGELIEAHPRSIRFNKLAYAQHLGLALPLKAAETMAEVAIGHAFPILTATTIGKWMFAGPEIAFLTPKTPEGTLFELGAALGLAAILGDALGRTLVATNVRELDAELGERAQWQRQFARNRKQLNRGLAVLTQWESTDFARATRGQLEAVDKARRAAANLRQLGAQLAAHPSAVAQQEASRLADCVAEYFAELPEQKRDPEASVTKQGTPSVWQATKSRLLALELRLKTAWQRGHQARKARRLRAQQHRLESDLLRFVAQRKAGTSPTLKDRLMALRTETERSIAYQQRQQLAGDVGEKETFELEASSLGHKQQILDALLRHPAVQGGRTIRRLAAYEQRAVDFERRQKRLLQRAEKVAQTPVHAKDAHHAAILARQLEARVGKIRARARQAGFAAQRARLDATLFVLVDQLSDTSQDPLTALWENRAEALKLKRGEQRAMADYLALRERQKRTSLYVAPAPQWAASAPRLVRLAVDSAWYSFAVMPGLNLPYWGLRWGWALGNDRLFAANLAATRASQATKKV